jgi:hypothetical protein
MQFYKLYCDKCDKLKKQQIRFERGNYVLFCVTDLTTIFLTNEYRILQCTVLVYFVPEKRKKKAVIFFPFQTIFF